MPASKDNRWQKDEDIFVAAGRLGTNLGWGALSAAFQKTFEGKTPNKKDLESRFNKNLKPKLDVPKDKRTVADIIDDYRHYGRATYPEEQEVIDKAIGFLESFDKADRVF
ncbi:hypothetical protein LOZ53_005217 [Ophidiomyces ophidiicola]|uniref:Uncharacterized protein n=1 Tax=Ophidiomyces ophidiicola TaxID=1387563 RepID=A0ACB8URM7_9EURO|nr:uncharacterized protein LOZ57_005013 [Ophidiomyces ophidiicola]KAI1909698.1 hypothetical protein LOZ64_005164 [Ophidiomyces ophidiicola]KAI1917460.1 hypothetical protein LOZ61_000523 [Ophidiomyces ophidiicola]KAI1920578.1 hypothetical protein LOZ60_006548 [Ophidiomyces ophidiicola]KAI1943304.1 hypothetical protein LOZ57_005013 [Ophidiomyces ophidiicola]KAI1947651.1 hypothetical protein LOZ59_006569 [Ophidiomyces ophidiicola]